VFTDALGEKYLLGDHVSTQFVVPPTPMGK
jgi:hypothetical protein